MYHDTTYEVKCGDPVYDFCVKETSSAKCIRNVSNYYIRNVMTGIKKNDPTPNEKQVLDTIAANISEMNARCTEAYLKRGQKILNDKKLTKKEKEKKLRKNNLQQFSLPTEEKWMLSYSFLDSLFKVINDPDYRSVEANVAQNAIRETCESWDSFFKALGRYKADPSQFTGKPKIPGYLKKECATATIGNQLAKIKDGMLCLPKKNRLDIRGYVPAGKLIEVRISPYYNGFLVHVITDDGIKAPEMSTAEGVMCIDPGVTNFLTVTDNTGHEPFIVRGGFLKSRNQYYNKTRAELVSILTKGKEPCKGIKVPETKRLRSISAKRDRFLRDCFYKVSHRIAREATRRTCGKIVIGKNVMQKQGINIGHVNNQNFIALPIARFIETLKIVCLKYGIEVIEQEESYTSKASFPDNDIIPVYGKDDNAKYSFSGKRICRGLYRSSDGTIINADVNGSLNIGRKYDKDLFKGKETAQFKSVTTLDFKDFYKVAAVTRSRSRVSGLHGVTACEAPTSKRVSV